MGGSFKETDIAMVDCVSSSTGMGEGVVVSGFLVAGEGVALFFVAAVPCARLSARLGSC